MGLFGYGNKDRKIRALEAELKSSREELRSSRKEVKRMKRLCDTKDEFFTEMISDGLRHGSPLAAKHMSDRKRYLKGK